MASHPTLFKVERRSGDYNSFLRAIRGFQRGEIICYLEGLTIGPKAYSSVQCGEGPNDHVELNSDLLYVNHSCEPNVAFNVSSSTPAVWHVLALRDIQPGETLTFFYPSTEWEMDQPFECNCQTKTCLGRISGAASLSRNELATRGFINKHIWKLVDRRDNATAARL